MYQKEIIYMGLHKDGSRLGSAGFLKVERRDREGSLSLVVKNVPHSISGKFPVRYYSGTDWKEEDGITLRDGGGQWEKKEQGPLEQIRLQIMLPGGYLVEGASRTAEEKLSAAKAKPGPPASADPAQEEREKKPQERPAATLQEQEPQERAEAVPQRERLQERAEAVPQRERPQERAEAVPQRERPQERAEAVPQRRKPREKIDIVPLIRDVQRKGDREEPGWDVQRKGDREEPGWDVQRKADRDVRDRTDGILRGTEEPSARQQPLMADTLSVEGLKEDKWEQILDTYDRIHPYGDERVYVKLTPRDFIILSSKYQHLVNNSFLLHGFYNYRHVILGKEKEYYLGVPGVFYEREKMVALMFGFEAFECESGDPKAGEFGYYLRKVEL